MTNDTINSVVRCAFRICMIYLLKCLVPNINFGATLGVCATNDYVKELNDQINIMRGLLVDDNCGLIDKNVKDKTKTDKYDSTVPPTVMKNIQSTITDQLKEKYGDNIEINFATDDLNAIRTEKNRLYALKIKEIGRKPPNEADLRDSEIYIDTTAKLFYVKHHDELHKFPLLKKSVVECERS